MRYLLTLLFALFTLAAYGQSPYLSLQAADQYGVEVGAQTQSFTFTFGVSGDFDNRKTASAGLDYYLDPVEWGSVTPFLSVGARGIVMQYNEANPIINTIDSELNRFGQESTHNKAGALGSVGLGVRVGSFQASTAIEQRLFADQDLYWVPLRIGVAL